MRSSGIPTTTTVTATMVANMAALLSVALVQTRGHSAPRAWLDTRSLDALNSDDPQVVAVVIETDCQHRAVQIYSAEVAFFLRHERAQSTDGILEASGLGNVPVAVVDDFDHAVFLLGLGCDHKQSKEHDEDEHKI